MDCDLVTLGVHNNKYISLARGFGLWFSILIPLLFAAMPVSMYFGWVD